MSTVDPTALPDERRRLIAEHLKRHGSVTVSALGERFGISHMTARRDLSELERRGIARRTHGGAVLPGPSSEEDAFIQRLEVEVAAKERLAAAAVAMLASGETVFIDSSTTGYYVARRIVRERLRCSVLTNSVPVMNLLCEHDSPHTELIGISGALRKLTRSFVGPQAIRAIASHFADKAVLSVKCVTPGGHLTDPDALEAEVKRTMIEHARTPLLLVDGTKFDRPALNAVVHVTDVARVLAADVAPPRLAPIERAGVAVDRV
ncbi:MAG TPA: DeoR/GlpR family DNA-binding transcription regulator [Solirubrobacteraceae bacterium]|nr:DeoR/GlpR family DNA-binding transcription regulator [Solirubrobacteraceae bacterium]